MIAPVRIMHDGALTSGGGCRDTGIMSLIETEEAARRLARAIASDLSLYNEDKIVNGITNDNLFQTLAEEIEEGRALFKRRVSPELYPRNFYDRALVDILIKAKGHIKSKIW
jgi:predicted transcriptional regulator